jgi:hypothetical protein
MTKPAGTPRKKPEPRRRKAALRDAGRLSSLTLSPPTLRSELDAAPVGPWPTPPSTASRTSRQTGPDLPRSFYLGSTSYASVFAEDRPLPDTVHQQPSERMSATPSSISSRAMGTRHCQMGVGHSVILRLAPFSFYEKALKMFFEDNNASSFVGPLILSLLPQLREDVQQLTAPDADLGQLYANITKNTAKPLNVPPSMLPSEFHTLVTGSNLRWETLGLILALAASNAQFTSSSDFDFTLEDGSKLDRQTYIEEAMQGSNDCITLCQAHGAVNDIMVWLVYANLHVVSSFYGDNCMYTVCNT